MNKKEERIIEEFLALAKIDAPSFQERAVADAIKELLEELEIPYEEDQAGQVLGGNCGNIYGVWEGEKDLPPVLLSAHMDTVHPALGKEPVLAGDRIISAGETVLGSDDLAGVVEILEGIRSVKEKGLPHRTVEILFTVAEEVYTKGASVFDYSKIRAREAYCLDMSGNVGTAARKAPSLISFQAEITGKASHAGFAPEAGINAILTAAEGISKIKQGRIDEETTLNIGTITGGVATNIVSEHCLAAGEIRSFDHLKALKCLEEVMETFETAAEEHGAKADVSYTIHFKAYEVEEDHPVVTNFLSALESLGIEGKVISTLGGADNHQFVANGIKGLVLSCGMEQVHTTKEYITVENLVTGVRLVEALIGMKH